MTQYNLKLNDRISPQMAADVVEMLATLSAALNWTWKRAPALCVKARRFSYPVTGKDRLVLIGIKR